MSLIVVCFISFILGFALAMVLGRKHPLMAAKTEEDLRWAWAECQALYEKAKLRIGVK